jgi:preprotein translocase subunit SecG
VSLFVLAAIPNLWVMAWPAVIALLLLVLVVKVPLLLGPVLGIVAILMILLVLVQRGRGGGLAGALGGMGGSSAFGAKAGDVFTVITGFAAVFWIALCIVAARWGAPGVESRLLPGGAAPPSQSATLNPSLSSPSDEESEESASPSGSAATQSAATQDAAEGGAADTSGSADETSSP